MQKHTSTPRLISCIAESSEKLSRSCKYSDRTWNAFTAVTIECIRQDMSNKIMMSTRNRNGTVVGHIPTRCITPPCSNFLPQQGIQVPLASPVHDEAHLKLEACPTIGNNDM